MEKKDQLASFYSFLASQIIEATKHLVDEESAKGVHKGKQLQVVCTGGGAKN